MIEKFKNMSKQGKIRLIGGVVEALILIFALIVSIFVMATANTAEMYPNPDDLYNANMKNGAMIGFFQNNPTWFFVCIVLPILLIVLVDLVYFALIASKKETNLSDDQMALLKKKAEEEARAEIMKELGAEPKEDK